MRFWLLAPPLMVLTSAVEPPPVPAEPIELAIARSMCGSGPAPAGATRILEGYGAGGFAVRTQVAEAQAFFSNGVQLAHAFAHQAAIDAFVEARRRDAACAMCAWGEAWSRGPTINFGVSSEDADKAAAIVAEAEKLAAGAPELERGLIAALKLRYTDEIVGRNRAFAEAMDTLAREHPADDALATLAADAWMIAGDWSKEALARPVELLEIVLGRNPDYAPAIHFYIHATEGAGFPERAERFADALPRLAPAASHLIHMPSHTYYWIGRYQDAASVNVRAVTIGEDDARTAGLKGDELWTVPSYHLHNVHFGLGGALMSGDGKAALALARPLIEWRARAGKVESFGQIVAGEAFVAVARFAAPEQMLALADPGADNPTARTMWRYARGEALARKGDLRGLKAEIRALRGQKAGLPRLATLGGLVLEARLAMLRGKPKAAVARLERAAAIEEVAPYGTSADPPLWWFPVRRLLATALLANGDAQGAWKAADASLKRRPHDPVALAVRGAARAEFGNAADAERDLADARARWRGDPAALVGPLS